jgi:hypothetical protein
MKLRSIIASLLGAALFFTLVVMAGAQEKQKKSAQDRVSGTIQMINKDTKVITVRTSGNVQRQVVYTDTTVVTNQNKPGGSIDQLKEGTRVICLGKFNEKTQLVAERIDIRLPR